MAFRRCQHDDPFTSRVRELYRANVVRAPRAGIEPLDVLAMRDRHVEPRGKLAPFIVGRDATQLPMATNQAAVALSGLRSVSLDLSVGLSLTSTFLAALGLPIPGAKVKTSLWDGVHSLSFEVRDVVEHSVDLGTLGQALRGKRVDRGSPASAVFFSDDSVRMLIITRTLTSGTFAVRSHRTDGQSADISVDAIADLVGAASATIKWQREADDAVTFHGDTPVTFAFAAVPCLLNPDDSFAFGLEADKVSYGDAPSVTEAVPVVDEDGLLEFDAV
jgi:hypothetical protein